MRRAVIHLRMFIAFRAKVAELLTRIAPTPSGYLHWGNAFSFVLTWLYAQKMSAKILLRIDDLDAARKRPEYVEDIFRSLEWLGLTCDLGPSGPDEFEANYSQRHRHDLYHEQLQWLAREGHVFACPCSRTEILSNPDKRHSAACRIKGHALTAPGNCWRFVGDTKLEAWTDLDQTRRAVNLDQEMRDPVLRRKDGLPAYQLASVVDDTHFGVNLVVRGEDLVASTAVQRCISRLLPQATFHEATLLHHVLVSDQDGRKLSKSGGVDKSMGHEKTVVLPCPHCFDVWHRCWD